MPGCARRVIGVSCLQTPPGCRQFFESCDERRDKACPAPRRSSFERHRNLVVGDEPGSKIMPPEAAARTRPDGSLQTVPGNES